MSIIFALATCTGAEAHLQISTVGNLQNQGESKEFLVAVAPTPKTKELASKAKEPPPSSPSSVELDVPYFPQSDNKINPSGSAGVTAVAMVFSYYGVQPKKKEQQLEDELSSWMRNRGLIGYAPDELVKLIKAYGFQVKFNEKTTWEEVKTSLRDGYPVIVAGFFTSEGHVVPIVGYTPTHMIVNDSYGDTLSGEYNTQKSGERIFYRLDFMNAALFPDGEFWAYFISP
ncbi:C39 family peptidase [Microcoleus sp. FACHB-672]|uniref:C39 family peptidase n=1 Tax=Microcoleus sp. FACHB-672 TaxID=2692825 RepID=UPI00168A225F|nr:C39 family peptidase [Microcoleus sp. FACHB-672]MBD2043916.1 C39 family peptidase [Microcoleus sp. FACHB-672]